MKKNVLWICFLFLLAFFLSRPASSQELLVIDWNPYVVTVDDHGFPSERNLMESANGDWTRPVDYAGGTLYHRLELRSMPTEKDMMWQCCFHQDGIVLENCGPMTDMMRGVTGPPPAVLEWSSVIADMWMLDGNPIDWSRPRSMLFLVVRKGPDEYISDYPSLNGGVPWAGEDPADWYPMEIRFTTVAVAAGGTFSGWAGYIEPGAEETVEGVEPVEEGAPEESLVEIPPDEAAPETADPADPRPDAPDTADVPGEPSDDGGDGGCGCTLAS